jgi:hypothetical protein
MIDYTQHLWFRRLGPAIALVCFGIAVWLALEVPEMFFEFGD